MSLAGQRVVVTGASRGIGAALARCFASRGASLVLVGRNKIDLERISTELGEGCEFIVADLSNEQQRVEMIVAAKEGGPIDVLVNNAGIGLYGAVEDLSCDQLRSAHELNVVAPAHLARLVLPEMRSRDCGTIVMVSSVLGRRSIPLSGGYCATKFALEALSQSLRAELSDTGVGVLVVRPGRTESAFREAAVTVGWRPEDDVRAMSAETVASATVRALEKRRSSIDFTFAGRAMIVAERVSPGLSDRLMSRLHRRFRKG